MSVTDQLDNFEQETQLQRGVAVLRASGRLAYEDDALDQSLVLDILSAVFPCQVDQKIDPTSPTSPQAQ